MCRLIGRRLITAYVVGRKSGRRYPVPAACSRRDGSLLVGFNKVGLDHDGEPIADDLHLAWAAGARLLVLTPG